MLRGLVCSNLPILGLPFKMKCRPFRIDLGLFAINLLAKLICLGEPIAVYHVQVFTLFILSLLIAISSFKLLIDLVVTGRSSIPLSFYLFSYTQHNCHAY